MSKQKEQTKHTILVSDSFGHGQEGGIYEVAFRRWLVREIEEERMMVSQAIERFSFNPESGRTLIYHWRQKYASEMGVKFACHDRKRAAQGRGTAKAP